MPNPEFKKGDFVEIFQGLDPLDGLNFKLGEIRGFSTTTGNPIVETRTPSEIRIVEQRTNDTEVVKSSSTFLQVSPLSLIKRWNKND